MFYEYKIDLSTSLSYTVLANKDTFDVVSFQYSIHRQKKELIINERFVCIENIVLGGADSP